MRFKLKKTVTQATVLTAFLPMAMIAFGAENNQVGDSSGSNVKARVRPHCIGDGYWTPNQATPDCYPERFADVGLRSSAATTAADAGSASSRSDAAAKGTAVAAVGVVAAAGNTTLLDPSTAPARGQYVYDSGGRNVRTGVTGECVRTGVLTPDTATLECDPDLFAKPGARAAAPAPEQPAAPELPAPAPTEYEAMEYAEAPEYEPAPYIEAPAAAEEPDFYAPGDVPGLVPVPPPSAEAEPDDRIGAPVMYYAEEEGVAPDDGIIGRTQYYEEETVAQDDGIVGRSQYYEEEQGVAQDDGIVGRSQYYEEEQGVAQDDGIVARSQYYEEETVAQDDGIVGRSQYYEEEEGVAQDDGIIGQSRYYEEEGKEPEDLISEPQAFPDAQVAAAGEEAAPEAAAGAQVAAAGEEAAPEAAEAEVQPSPVMLPVTVTLEAEPWFDFDRYAVRSDARDKLDRLAEDMSAVDYDEIIVVGHADRIGTFKYNQRLSERRANSVKKYLVGKGVPAGRIKTEGRGEYEPSLDPAVCKGMRKRKLIDCLQPDRRVEVTVTGTKPQ